MSSLKEFLMDKEIEPESLYKAMKVRRKCEHCTSNVFIRRLPLELSKARSRFETNTYHLLLMPIAMPLIVKYYSCLA